METTGNDEAIQRRTAKRRMTLVLSLLKGETTPQDAAGKGMAAIIEFNDFT